MPGALRPSGGYLRIPEMSSSVFATARTDTQCYADSEIWLEGLYRDLNCRICVWTPQFVTGEHYGVQPLRIVTLIDGCRVRIHVTALTPFYDAQLSPRVARQACVGLRMDVSSAHAVPWFEECRCLLLAEE